MSWLAVKDVKVMGKLNVSNVTAREDTENIQIQKSASIVTAAGESAVRIVQEVAEPKA